MEVYAGRKIFLVCVLKGAVPFTWRAANILIPILRWTLWSFQVMVAELSAVVVKVLKMLTLMMKGRDITSFIERYRDTGALARPIRDMFKYQ